MLPPMGKSADITPVAETEAERIKRAFGQVVARHREASPYHAQRLFSRVAGISNSHLRKIEAGLTAPTLVTIVKIASTLDEEPADLVAEACALAHLSPKTSLEYLPPQV